jgi:hypothetical protein
MEEEEAEMVALQVQTLLVTEVQVVEHLLEDQLTLHVLVEQQP